ncbi:MAG: AAA family ATPase [gamma proteobacterium symbiont of Taylorina sp.]|nr:AAA family ATPase [gamma proteobacterium symbiont of Taylorina sp.]
MAYIKRNLHNKMNELLGYFPCLVIWGPRQCGKTILSTMLRPKWKYFDLENPQTFDKIHEDMNFFFNQNNTDIIIDEAQLSSKLFQVLRGVIDEKRELNNRFILTGSSSPELLKNTTETLAGRVAMVELSPFKVNELQESPLPIFYSIFDNELSTDNLNFFNKLKPIVSQQKLFTHFLEGGYPTPLLSNNKVVHKNWME